MNNWEHISDKVKTIGDFFEANKHILYQGDFMIDSNSVIAYVVGILLVALVCRIMTKPVKWIVKLILNGLLGGVMLIIINAVGGSIGLNIPINPVSALISGILGFPGVILLVLIGLMK